ncbi:MAG: Type IIS restriction enzyme Eco57I [Phycisphaerae bacterium]|nr:Type IIS restriction enzyme Eco57I [Phycisphaerae bacterium]
MLVDLRGDEPVDRVFLDYLQVYRRHFAQAIYRENKKEFPDAGTLHGAARLTEAVQRLIDRLVFMRVCEDRGVSRWGGLRDTLERVSAEGGDLYGSLLAQFRQLDREYNGYLFKPHPLTETLKVPDVNLADFITNLYPPDGPWDFSAIGDEILGIVYERFLGSVVTVRNRQVDIEEKPEVRHAGGVYYTPRFVVETIIRRVIGPKIAGKSPLEILDVKVLDPACGSGSFLVAAFQYLMDHCLAAIQADPSLATVPASPRARKKRKDIAFQDDMGNWRLAPDFRAAILTNCLHGVDIDQQAVEVTVMSLYLKMLEGKLPPNWQRDWLERELLPSLDNNIQCGNSLIDSESFDAWLVKKHGDLFPLDEDARFRINRFDWTSRTRGFGRLLDTLAVDERGRQGFDCIIGNPPYIRVQELNKWAPQECEFYKWKYKAAAKGNYDIYVVFTERSLELLAPDGLLGFIMPHKFWQATYGEGLRKLVADGKHLRSVVDFGDEQVFIGATTYTAIHALTKSANPNGVDYARISRLVDGLTQCATLDAGGTPVEAQRFLASHPVNGSAWCLQDHSEASFMKQVGAEHPRLGEVASIFVGLQTSADRIYCLESGAWPTNPVSTIKVRDNRGKQWTLERDVLRPFLYDVSFGQYDTLSSQHALLFPYKVSTLIPATEMKERYPAAWAYLRFNESALRARESGKADTPAWYGYVYRKNLTLFEDPKLIVPVISQRARYANDKSGLYFTGGGNGPYYGVRWKPGEGLPPLEYLQGLLNSRLLDGFLKQVSSPFRGGYWSYGKRFIEQIPIKLPDTADEKRKAQKITESVRAIVAAKTTLRAGSPPLAGAKGGLRAPVLSDREIKTLESEVESHERRIDELVFQLYGVDGLPGG